MRILIISTNVVKWGGSEELWRRIASKALEAGHEVMVSVFMHKPLHQKILDLGSQGARIHRRPFPSYFKLQRFSGRVLAELKMRTGLDKTKVDWLKVESFQPEAVLISSGETFDYTISKDSFIVRYCLENQTPYYLISQFNWEHDMDISMDFRNSRKDLSLGAAGHLFVSYRNYKNAEMQIASQIPNARIISNPVKLQLADPIPYPKGKTLKLAMMARYQTFIKGQDLLLQALSDPSFEDIDFELSFYGSEGIDGPHIQNLINHYNLSSKVFLKGPTQDVESVWREHHICVLTSRAEGTSLALLEAMYCGRTAIVTCVGDSQLWVGEQGYNAESNTVESLRKTLMTAFQNAESWEDQGQLCHQKVLDHLHFEQDLEIVEVLAGKRKLEEVGDDPLEFVQKIKASNFRIHE